MNILLFGAPGAGKGTQSSLLVERLGMVQISTGDLFRAAIKNDTQLGRQAKSFMDKGELVPDSVVVGMVREVLNSIEGKPFILDGFPRTVPQAEALGMMLSDLGVQLGKAIFLEVPNGILLERLTGRRVCQSCGAVFHMSSKPTKVSGVCDACGGVVVQRNDDKEEVIATRLKAYEENTLPLRSFYKSAGIYSNINGDENPEVIFETIKKIIRLA